MKTISANHPNVVAAQKALSFCEQNPGWKRICDISEIDIYEDFSLLPKRYQEEWRSAHGHRAERAYKEFGPKKPKYPSGYINSEGNFYSTIVEVQEGSGMMLIVNLKMPA